MDAGVIPITTGFIGATPEGAITTLGRGGSDYSAAIIGAVLPADDVWIWTDVDGVMTTDPRIVKEAQTLPEISYNEIAELAYYGAKVLHPKTIRPVVDAGIGLRICNTFNPSPWHALDCQRPMATAKWNGKVIKAVTAIRKQSWSPSKGAVCWACLAWRRAHSERWHPQARACRSSRRRLRNNPFVLPCLRKLAPTVLSSLEKAFAHEIEDEDIDRVWATEDVSIITVVGAGMRHTPGVSGRVFSKLGNDGVNVLAIAQGSSEVSISLVVDSVDTENAVKALHELIVQ
jgi:aspartokinase/homoserine dehydrogenase 1